MRRGRDHKKFRHVRQYREFLPTVKKTTDRKGKEVNPSAFSLLIWLRDAGLHTKIISAPDAKRKKTLLSHADYLLLDALIKRANPNEEYTSFPSIALLMEDTGLSIGQIDASKKRLHELNLIDWKRRFDKSNMWYVNAGLLEKHADDRQAERARLKAERKARREELLDEDDEEVIEDDGVDPLAEVA